MNNASFEAQLKRDLARFAATGSSAPASRPIHNTTSIAVHMSVRHVDASGTPYGNAFKYVYRDKTTISALQAEINARRAAKGNGYVVWALLGVEQTDA